MKINFWSGKNLKEGFLIIISSIIASLFALIPAWFAHWLMISQGMFAVSVLILIADFFFYVLSLGFIYRKWFR